MEDDSEDEIELQTVTFETDLFTELLEVRFLMGCN